MDLLLTEVNEPYATMIYTAYYSGLRPSELNGLKIEDVKEDCLIVRGAYSRGQWKKTKTKASAAAIYVPPQVIERLARLQDVVVSYRSGGQGAKRTIKCMRELEPTSLVFQSLHKGAPMNDGNIRNRHIKPAALKLGSDPKKTNWQVFRRSYGTWLADSGANLKDVQAQMRHSKSSTTADIYMQIVPESQKRAVDRMMMSIEERRKEGSENTWQSRGNSNPILSRKLAQSAAASC